MKDNKLTIEENVALCADVYKMVLSGAEGKPCAGQFIEIAVDGYYLRRPFGVADYCDGKITVIYKVQGRGTETMTTLECGRELDVLYYLGNGFDLDKYQKPLLIGGGMGAAPLLYLAKEFNARGIRPSAILGFRSKDEIFLPEEFCRYSDVSFATDDGSCGFRGNAVQRLLAGGIDYDGYFACGPEIMLKYLQKATRSGQMSLEARMGCGFGACMGCSIETTNGAKRVCKEGPVFDAAEVIFK